MSISSSSLRKRFFQSHQNILYRISATHIATYPKCPTAKDDNNKINHISNEDENIDITDWAALRINDVIEELLDRPINPKHTGGKSLSRSVKVQSRVIFVKIKSLLKVQEKSGSIGNRHCRNCTS